MILSIDSTDSAVVKLGLTYKQEHFEHIFESQRDFSEKLLPEIEKFLKKRKKTLKDLKNIEVKPGFNGFSRSRTTVATANALAYALNISVNGLKAGILAEYDREPNITMVKN
jgi:tRNA A37 threonylcarbamoyladenosine modification protein TsaB